MGSVTFATATTSDETPTKPIGQLIWESHARSATHPQPLPLPPADPILGAKQALTVDDLEGRTAMGWVDMSSAARLLSLRSGEMREADLATEVARLSALAGVAADAADINARADAVPVELQAPLAALVATVADAYGEQKLLAGSVDLTAAERDATIARADAILAAVNDLRAIAEGVDAPMTAAPIFTDGNGLVILGGGSDDAWAPIPGAALKDPILLVDLGGSDTYTTSAGGACGAAVFHSCNGVPLSIVADFGGNDQYLYDGVPYSVQGSGSIGALGMLIDATGDDHYSSTMTRVNSGPSGQYQDGIAQGGANAGVGLLIDGEGTDVYQANVATTGTRSIWNFAQGFGGYGGYGALADGAGDDMFSSLATGPGDTSQCRNAQGFNICNFIGVYTNGVGFYGGVGVQVDQGMSQDVYRAHAEAKTTDFYAVGFAAFGGAGIFYEDGGNDDYAAGHIAENPFIQPLLNCAFGTGSFGGVGVFLEMGGDDDYLGYSSAGAGRYAYTMNEGFAAPAAGYGLFIDLSGDDGHFMQATGGTRSDTFGRGVLLEHGQFIGLSTDGSGGGNHVGNYLDLGGNDQYTGASPSADNTRWSGGADLNLVPSVALAAVLG